MTSSMTHFGVTLEIEPRFALTTKPQLSDYKNSSFGRLLGTLYMPLCTMSL